MRILQITSNDAKTGGAIAVTRLHEALLKEGHTSCILSFADLAVSDGIKRLDRPPWWRGLDSLARRMIDALALPDIYKPSVPLIRRAIGEFRPDIIHLHWTYSHGLPLSMLPLLTRRYPLVWTFHDMYAFTGGCTNSLNCERWRRGCGKCPQSHAGLAVSSMRPLRYDTTAFTWRLKRRLYARSRFTIVAPSRWMTELAQQSPLLVGKPIHHVINCLDCDFWKPLDKAACKIALDIEPEKRVLLFIGKPDNVFAYPGRRLVLSETLRLLQTKWPQLAGQIVLLLVGEGGQAFTLDGYQVVAVRTVTSSAMLRICHNAADLLISPTQFDNLPGIIQEALACGTPVVASIIGGIPDLVYHNENGLLACHESPQEFAEAIQRVLADSELWLYLSSCARQMAVAGYHDRLVVRSMLDVYKSEIAFYNAAPSIHC